jgi:hypothetical protein
LKWEPNCLFAKMVSSKVPFFDVFRNWVFSALKWNILCCNTSNGETHRFKKLKLELQYVRDFTPI